MPREQQDNDKKKLQSDVATLKSEKLALMKLLEEMEEFSKQSGAITIKSREIRQKMPWGIISSFEFKHQHTILYV